MNAGIRGRLLVVDDDPDVRDSLGRALRLAGYTVSTVVNGADALASVTRSPVDLIVLDMLMPVLDGWHFLQRLRKLPLQPPVIVTTGTILTREWARDHGCQGLLRKPIETDQLLAEVRLCLGEG